MIDEFRAATEKDWALVSKYFTPDSKVDNWGNPFAISASHLHRLYDFRHYLGLPIYVTAGVKSSGHTDASYHYEKYVIKLGSKEQVGPCATDVIIPDFNGNCVELVLAAERFGFGGIGYYPHWRYSGVVCGGMHLDSRPYMWESDSTINYRHARWLGVPRDGKQVYLPLDYYNLKKYGEIYGVY